MSDATFRLATRDDLDVLVALMRDFYAHERIRFEPDVARAAMRGLLEDASHGRVWLVVDADGPAGYVVLTVFGCLLASLVGYGAARWLAGG